jgi:hypothetical protein
VVDVSRNAEPAQTGPLVRVGRQPLHRITGELLGRDLIFGLEPSWADLETDGMDPVSRSIQATFTEFSVPDLAGDGEAMVGLPRRFVLGDTPMPFPASTAMVRTALGLDGAPADVAALALLVGEGHPIVLDGYAGASASQAALELSRWVLVDVGTLSWNTVQQAVALTRAAGPAASTSASRRSTAVSRSRGWVRAGCSRNNSRPCSCSVS